jgi:Spy/CpxP family protein refolding chaperone
MPNKSMKRALIAAATLSLSTLVFSAAAVAADGVKINELVVAKTP